MDNENIYETVLLHRYVHPDSGHPSYPRDEPSLVDRCRRDPRNNRRLPTNVPFELEELGVSGMVEILEKGSLLSGRGEYRSAEAAMHDHLDQERSLRARTKSAAKQRARDTAVATRRRILKIPFIPVGIEFGRPSKER